MVLALYWVVAESLWELQECSWMNARQLLGFSGLLSGHRQVVICGILAYSIQVHISPSFAHFSYIYIHLMSVMKSFDTWHVSGWSRGRAVRSIRWGWTTFCRSWDSTMPGLLFPSGCREEWWTLWIKFCPFSLRNLARHYRMRKRRKVKETKMSINSNTSMY